MLRRARSGREFEHPVFRRRGRAVVVSVRRCDVGGREESEFDTLFDEIFDAPFQGFGSGFERAPDVRTPEGIFVEGFFEGVLPEVEERRGGGVVGLGIRVVVESGGEFAGDEDETDGWFGDEGVGYDAAWEAISNGVGWCGCWATGRLTRTAPGQTPVFLFHDEALQP